MIVYDTKIAAQEALNEIDTKIYSIDANKIPDDLKSLDNWVLWKCDIRKQGDKYALSKVPYQINGKTQASSTDPKTWSSFENIIKNKRENLGLGFVFSPDNDILGIDIDNCIIDKKEIPENVKTLIKDTYTYKEASVSITGVHLIGRGQLPESKGRKLNKLLGDNIHVEMYQQGRYFTISTRKLSNCAEINNIQNVVDKLLQMHNEKNQSSTPPKQQPQQPDKSNDKLLDKIRKSKQGQKFTDLYDTDDGWKQHYPSQSEADLALTCMLRWWTGHDRTFTEQLFRQSKLYRDKYDRDDIREGLWTKAQQFVDTQYDDKKGYIDPTTLPPLYCLERSPDKIEEFFNDNPDENVIDIITYQDDYRIFVKCQMNDKTYTISFSDYLSVKFKISPISGWKRNGRNFASKDQEGVKGYIILNNAAAQIVGNTGNWNSRQQRDQEAQEFYQSYQEQNNDKN